MLYKCQVCDPANLLKFVEFRYMIYLIPFDSTDAGEPGSTGTSESVGQSG